MSDERAAVLEVAELAKVAQRELATATRATKDAALLAMAAALRANTKEIETANASDVADAKAGGTSAALIDRLTLDTPRIESLAAAVVAVAALTDPIGEVIRGWRVPNGLQINQIRVPFGVVGMIYEARPNVTVDAAALGYVGAKIGRAHV